MLNLMEKDYPDYIGDFGEHLENNLVTISEQVWARARDFEEVPNIGSIVIEVVHERMKEWLEGEYGHLEFTVEPYENNLASSFCINGEPMHTFSEVESIMQEIEDEQNEWTPEDDDWAYEDEDSE